MSPLQLYNMWYCPFGQRAWVSLLYKGVDFEYIEQVPYNKTPEWLAINPRGLVPAIVHDGKVVCESSICIEYVDELYPDDKPLLPKDPYSRAKVRMWSDHISKKIVPPYFAVLLKKTVAEREAAKGDILTAVALITEAMDAGGPFFMGKDFGMVDIMLAPFAYLFTIITPHYRGFGIPEEEKFERYHSWWRAVKEIPCLKDTFPDKDKLIEIEAEYADGTATSEAAMAVKSGKVIP